MKCFQFKILYDILFTNSRLAKMALIQSDLIVMWKQLIIHSITVLIHAHFWKSSNLIGSLQPKNERNSSQRLFQLVSQMLNAFCLTILLFQVSYIYGTAVRVIVVLISLPVRNYAFVFYFLGNTAARHFARKMFTSIKHAMQF